MTGVNAGARDLTCVGAPRYSAAAFAPRNHFG